MSFLTNLQERAVEGLKGFFTQYWDPDEKRNIIYTKGKTMLVDSEEEEILGLGGPSAGVAPSYLGKIGGINADFTVARTSDTQLTLSAFTPDVAQIYESDIEKIRQCTAAGVLVKEWTHINATINDSGASVLTVAEATFVAGDLITVFTNIPRLIDVSVANLNVDLTSVSGNYLIGKDTTATNADFTTADNGDGDGILLSGYPDYALSGFVGDDIEFVRQINAAGKVVETYSKDDADMNIAANVLTVTGATFAASDTFVVYTNIAHSINTTKVLGLDTYTEGTTKGNIVGAVRKDTPGTLADTDNEFAPVQLNALGNQRTDLASVVDTAIDVNSGNLSAGTQRFTLATDDVNTSAIKASVELLEAGLAAPTAFRSTAVDETGGVAVKAATGDVYGWNFYNPNTYDVFVKFYNTAQGSVVVGTTAVVETLQVPSLGSVVIKQDAPIKSFSIAITIAATKLVADNDDTAIISDVFAHVYYK